MNVGGHRRDAWQGNVVCTLLAGYKERNYTDRLWHLHVMYYIATCSNKICLYVRATTRTSTSRYSRVPL